MIKHAFRRKVLSTHGQQSADQSVFPVMFLLVTFCLNVLGFRETFVSTNFYCCFICLSLLFVKQGLMQPTLASDLYVVENDLESGPPVSLPGTSLTGLGPHTLPTFCLLCPSCVLSSNHRC